MLFPELEYETIRRRQHELWNAAAAYRHRCQARAGQPRLRDRCLGTTGQGLIAWGLWLHRRAHRVVAYGQRLSTVRTRDASVSY